MAINQKIIGNVPEQIINYLKEKTHFSKGLRIQGEEPFGIYPGDSSFYFCSCGKESTTNHKTNETTGEKCSQVATDTHYVRAKNAPIKTRTHYSEYHDVRLTEDELLITTYRQNVRFVQNEKGEYVHELTVFKKGWIQWSEESYEVKVSKDGKNYQNAHSSRDLIKGKSAAYQLHSSDSVGFENWDKVDYSINPALYTRTGLKEYYELFNAYQTKNLYTLIDFLDYQQKNPHVEQLLKSEHKEKGYEAIKNKTPLRKFGINEESSVKKMLGIPKYAEKYLSLYESEKQIETYLRLIRAWKVALNEEVLSYYEQSGLMRRARTEGLVNVGDLIEYGFTHTEIRSYLERVDEYQALPAAKAIEYFRDYHRMARGMNMVVERFPNSLIKAHDLMQREHKVVLNKEMEEAYQKIKTSYKHFEYEVAGYVISVPATLQAVVQEGHNLSHCVASYVKRIVANETMIFFLRKKSLPGQSYVTIEYRNEQIHQVKGFANSRPSIEVEHIVVEWGKRIQEIEKKRKNKSA